MLDQAKAFLEDSRKEVLILRMSHFCGKEGVKGNFRHDAFMKLIGDRIGPYLLKASRVAQAVGPEQFLPLLKVGKLVANGPRVILVYDDAAANQKETDGYYRRIPLYDVYSETDVASGMAADQIGKLRANPGSSSRLFLLSWTVTFQARDVRSYLSLRSMTETANPLLGSALRPMDKGLYRANVISVNFFADSRVTDIAIERNR